MGKISRLASRTYIRRVALRRLTRKNAQNYGKVGAWGVWVLSDRLNYRGVCGFSRGFGGYS